MHYGVLLEMTYDRYDWHSEGDYPEDLDEECAGTHIGMFLAWAITRDLIGDIHREESSEWIQKVQDRTVTGRDFLFSMCDGKFWTEDLSDKGNAFAQQYYSGSDEEAYGQYIVDYEEQVCPDTESIYQAEDTWINFEKLAMVIDKRYATWNNQQPIR